MTCPGQDKLQLLIDELLTPGDAAAVAGHVDACAECQAALDELASGVFVDEDESSSAETLDLSDRNAIEELIGELKENPGKTLDESADVAASSHLQLPSQIGPYQLLKMVGQGGTGRLYRAFDENLERIVAVKTLRSELAAVDSAQARFEREARACAALNHDHIVSVYQVDSGDPDEGIPPHLVMEYVEGGSLQDRLSSDDESRDEIDLRTKVEWIRQTALALDAAHAQGIVHRDIKPSNLLIDETTGRILVADFGLARLTEVEEQITTEGMIAGTPAYMSPEQIVDPAAVDGRSDVYSLGVVLYQVLTAELPFRGIVRMVLHQVLHEEPAPPRRLNDSLPRDLENICLKAMSKERPLRYQTAKAFAEDLQRWLDGHTVTARPVGLFRRAVRWCRRNPRPAGLGTIVMAVLIAGAVDWKQHDSSREQKRREAVALRSNAILQKDAANRQRDMVIRALHTLIIEVQNKLQSQPGTRELRKSILEAAQEELDRLAEVTGSDSAAELATAVAQNRLGDIYVELDDWERAGNLYLSAEGILRSCLKRGSSPVLSRQTLARSLWQLGAIDLKLNRPAQAATRYQQALSVIERAVEIAGEMQNELLQRSTQRDLGLAQQRLGEVEEQQGHLISAASHYQSAQQTLEQLLAYSPGDLELQRDRAVLLLALATLAVDMDRGGVGRLFDQAQRSFASLATSQPDLPSAQLDLAACVAALGSWHLANDRLDEAIQLFEQECGIVRNLSLDSANRPAMMREYAQCQLRLASVLCRAEDWQQADGVIASARQNLDLLTRLGWDTTQDRLCQAEARMLTATLEFARGNTAAAGRSLQELQSQLDQFPSKPEASWAGQLKSLRQRSQKLREALN